MAEFGLASQVVEAQKDWMVDLFYSDAEGGQRVISRFAMLPRDDGEDQVWLSSAAHHWNIDRSDPR